MNRDVIFAIVIMVFVYLIGKYKLLPYFAAKKILKDAKNGKAATDAASQPQSPDIVTQMLLAQSLGHSMTNTQPQPEKPEHRYMYFDYRVISLGFGTLEEPEDVDVVGSSVGKAVEEFLATLRNHCICPSTFDIVCLDDGLFLAYVTYVA